MAKFKRVSADEAHAKAKELRRDFVRDAGGGATVHKAAVAPASWSDETRSARFVMTSQAVDRYGDIVVTAGIDTTEFLRNPVGLLFHNSRFWPVANWRNVEVLPRTRPPRIEGDFAMLPEGGPVKEVDECAWMIANGGIRACSIGFDADWDEVEFILDDEEQWITGFKFNKSELLECSVCSIPANADALAKSAHGDVNLAKELLEDVLDNWVKTPAGILLNREDFETTHKGLSMSRSFSFVEKDLVREPKIVASDDIKLSAATEEEARALIGAKVMPDPAHPENKDWPFDVLAKASGEVIDSFIVDHGPNEGVHGLCVEFLTDDFSGMFRGIKAERFLLVKAATVAEPSEVAPADAATLNFSEQVRAGDVIVLEFRSAKKVLSISRDGSFVDSLEFASGQIDAALKAYELCNAAAGQTPKQKETSIEINVDTTEAIKSVEALNDAVEKTEQRVEGLFARISKFFGGAVVKDRIEPTMDNPPAPLEPPTDDEIAAAKARAASIRERIAAKGMIAV